MGFLTLISSLPGILILPLIPAYLWLRGGGGVCDEPLIEAEKSQVKFTDGSEWNKTQAKIEQEGHSAPQAGWS